MNFQINASGSRKDGECAYQFPEQWRDYNWISDPFNYPDPSYAVFKDEYDWDYRGSRGLIYKYANHIEGSAYAEKCGIKVSRKTKPKARSYYLFAMAAVHLHNEPDQIRRPHNLALSGGFVVNYLNSIRTNLRYFIDLNTTSDSEWKSLTRAKHLIPVQYSALFARVFNATSGIREKHKLKIEPREDKKLRCPNPECKCIYEQLSKDFRLPNDPEYANWNATYIDQSAYRTERNTHG